MRRLRLDCRTFFDILADYKIEFVAIVMVAILGLIAFNYGDGQSLMVYSIQIWDALFSGRIADLPQLYLENARGAPHGGIGVGGSILITGLPWAIWNLPIWLASTFLNLDSVLIMPCLAWAKLFLVVCSLIAGVQCYYIVLYLTKEKTNSKLAAVFFWGSSTLTISVAYSMQDEIVYLLMFLIAIRKYLENKKVQSFIWILISFIFAPFMLLIQLVFLLFIEKRIWAIFLRLAIMAASYITVISIIPATTTAGDNYIEWFLGRAVLDIGLSTISVYFVVLIGLYAFAYFYKCEDQNKSNYMLFYLLAIASSLMCILSWLHFYRYVVCVPFLIIAIFGKRERSNTILQGCMLVFLLFELSRLVGAVFFDSGFLDAKNLSDFLKTFVDDNLSSVIDLIERSFSIHPETILMIKIFFGSIICGLLMVLFWLMGSKRKDITAITKNPRILSIVYVYAPLVFYLSYFAVILSFHSISTQISTDSLLAPPITDTQIFESIYLNKGQLKSISIHPVTWDRTYPEDLILHMDIFDSETGEIVNQSTVNANDLPNNSEYIFNVSNSNLKNNHFYEIELYTSGNMRNEEDYIYLLRSDDNAVEKSVLSLGLIDKDHTSLEDVSYNIISTLFYRE